MAAARPAVVGGFLLGALALGVAGILFFGGTRLFAQATRAVVFFEGSVAGLDVGAPVTFRGVRLGSVQSVALRLSTSGAARIPVVIELLPGQVFREGEKSARGEPGLEQMVAAGLRAQLNSQSFVTGQLRVDLDFRPDTPAELLPTETGGIVQIPAIPSDFDRLRSTLAEVPVQEVMQTAQRTLIAVERMAVRLDTALQPLLDSAQRSVETATRALGTAEQAVVKLHADTTHTLQEVDELAAGARRQIDARGAELARVLGSADRATRQAETLLASLNSLTAPRSQVRGDLEAAIRDLAASAGSLRGFARTIERDPSAVLRGRDAR
ncbi:MlaD family protein [Pseudoroseomonas sp. WGS1072]|uniref:MlaD family protein n=1 Tax=Roseomonas sp. WGS1072 TaxID=3366816 RepID=UPI003BF2AFC6